MFAHETITMGRALIVCGFSLVVVFLVLLAISYMIDLVHWLLTKGQKKPAAAPATLTLEVSEAPAKDPPPDAAIISAAIAACLGTAADRIVVRSIRRVAGEETPWIQSGRLNTIQ